VGGNQETVVGASPAQLAATVDLRVRRGSIAAMDTDGALVAGDTSRQYHLAVGDPVAMQTPQGILVVHVAGIFDQRDFTGGLPVGFVVALPAYEQGFGTSAQDSLVYVRARAGHAAAVAADARRALRDRFPNVHVFTRAQYRADQERAIDRFLAVAIALLMLSELIAVLGIVNTLALSVFERTRELGLLRVVGMTRRQLRRMIRAESVLVAVLGGLVGAAVGVFWGWVFTRALRAQGVTTFSVPALQLVAFLALAMVAGVVASLGPAWRAARLDVLEAIAEE
jgi:putative ABC transport system permease protein